MRVLSWTLSTLFLVMTEWRLWIVLSSLLRTAQLAVAKMGLLSGFTEVWFTRCETHPPKSATQWFLVNSESCAITRQSSFRTFYHPRKIPCIYLGANSCFYAQSQATIYLLYVPIDLHFLEMSYQWDHTRCSHLCLSLFA